MRLSITRCLLFVVATSVLGLTACAPKGNPQPFPVNTSAPTTSETVAKEYTDSTKDAKTTDEKVAEDKKATTDEKAVADKAAAEGDKATEATDKAKENVETVATTSTNEAKAKEEANIDEANDEDPVAQAPDKVAASATWQFTITDKGLQTTNEKPALVKSATFSVTNKTSDAYSFKLEGKKEKIDTIAPNATATCVCSDLGAGLLTVSAKKVSKQKGVDFKPATLSINIADPNNR